MRIRAIIFDVYNTLLRVGPPPANADAQWERLFAQTFETRPPLTRLEFSVACSKVITKLHTAARLRGIAFPEINWPRVVLAALPDLTRLSARAQDEFVFQQMQIGRTIQLFEGAGKVLKELGRSELVLGIASNAQAYTEREVTELLAPIGVHPKIFEPSLCVWSYQSGFSKPDPHVFQILATRLEARGISAPETLMVGDRIDNDIEPARKFGFQTWQMCEQPRNGLKNGNWSQLRDRVRVNQSL